MSVQFKHGQVVYGLGGYELRYVGALEGVHYARTVYENPDGSEGLGDPEPVEQLFAEPLKPRLDAEAAALQKQVEQQRETLYDLQADIRDFERQRAARLASLKQHEALGHIEDFIAGRISHFVLMPKYGRVEVVAREAALKTDQRVDRDTKLLTLYGRTNGDLQWQLNQYSDGSGYSVDVRPFTNEADAIAFAKQEVAARLTAAEALPNRSHEYALLDAAKFGVPIPESLEKSQRALRLAMALKDEAEVSKKLAEIQARIAANTEPQ